MPGLRPGIAIALEVSVSILEILIVELEYFPDPVIQERPRTRIGARVLRECRILVIDIQIVQFLDECLGLIIEHIQVMIGMFKVEVIAGKVSPISRII